MKRMKWKLAAMAFIALLSACSIQNASEVKRVDALDASAWNVSKWISAVNAPVITGKTGDMENNRAADGASWFVSTVKNEQKVVSAKWMTAGLGVYEIFVNGQLIGEEFLKPGYTHYAKTKRSFTYDVTAVLQTGEGAENQFSAQVTPGWWADKIHTPHGYEGFLGMKCAFRGVLELTYADGSKKLYGTDLEIWKAGIAGPVTHAAIFDGEAYDVENVKGKVAAFYDITNDSKFRTDLPAVLTLGPGYRVFDPLYLSLGFNYYFNNFAHQDSILSETDYDNSWEIAFGADYRFCKIAGASAGLSYSNQGITDSSNSTFNPVLDSLVYGAGIDFYPVERLTVTLSGMYTQYFDADYNLQGNNTVLSKDVLLFSLGVTYKLF